MPVLTLLPNRSTLCELCPTDRWAKLAAYSLHVFGEEHAAVRVCIPCLVVALKEPVVA